MVDVAIRADNVTKWFDYGAHPPETRLSELLQNGFVRILRSPATWLSGSHRRAAAEAGFWALRDVTFDIRQGEVVGVIGRNGAGKSTLLKVVSQITEPTTGRVGLRGKVGSLLEVGTGFHPELTGRENIFLNGAILGMSRRDIERQFNAIVDFAGVEKFLDMPVKHYSSGMYVRLGFAVAAHLDTAILLVDEVLAVGDAAFQQKCLGKMSDIGKSGRTVLFVSHNLAAVRALCGRCIWMDAGRVAMDAGAAEVTSAYLASLRDAGLQRFAQDPGAEGQIELRRVVLRNGRGEPVNEFHGGDGMTVEIHFRCTRRHERPHFWVGIKSQFGPLLGANMLLDGRTPDYIEGDGVLTCTFDALPLLPQSYIVYVGVRGRDGMTPLAPSQDAAEFQIIGLMRDYGLDGAAADSLVSASTPVVVPYRWTMPDGRTVAVNAMRERRDPT